MMKWKAYFWLMSLLLAVALALEFAEPSDVSLIDVIDYLSSGFSLIAVFGYAYSRALINPGTWRIWLPIVVVWDIVVLARQVVKEDIGFDAWTLAAMIVFGSILVIPEYVAVYRYGNRRLALWASKTTPSGE